MITVSNTKEIAMDTAKKELAADIRTGAVKKMKVKLKEIHLAAVALKNLERELEDLELEIENGV